MKLFIFQTKRFGIRKKITFLLIGAGVVFLVGIYGFIAPHLRQMHTEVITNQQTQFLRMMQQQIDNSMVFKLNQLAALAQVFPLEELNDKDKLQQLIEHHVNIDLLFDNGLTILSAAGIILAETPANPQRTIFDFSTQPIFLHALAANTPTISVPFRSTKPPHHPVVQFFAPIRDGAGKVVALLSGGMRLDGEEFFSNISKYKISKTGNVYIYTHDRTILVHSNRSRILQQDVPAGKNILFDKALTGWDGTGYSVNSFGHEVISSFKHLISVPWILVSNYPLKEAYAPVWQLTTFLALVILTIGTFCMVGISFALRSLTVPLMALTTHMQKMKDLGNSAGKFPQFRHSVVEIRSLTYNLNKMMRLQQKQREEIIHLTRLYKILSAINQFIVRKPQPQELYQFICNTLFLDGTFTMAWIGEVDDNGYYTPVAAAGMTIEELREVFNHNCVSRETGHVCAGFQEDLSTPKKLCSVGQRIYEMHPFVHSKCFPIVPSQAQEIALVLHTNDTTLFTNASEQQLMEELIGDVAYALDIAFEQRKQTETLEQLRLVSTVFENTTEAIVVTDNDNNIVEMNRAFVMLSGYSYAEMIGKNPRTLKSDRHEKSNYENMWRQLIDTGHWEGEVWDTRKNGEEYPKWLILDTFKDNSGEIKYHIGVSVDLSKIKKAEQRVHQLAFYDPLTGLPNRVSFIEELERRLPNSSSHDPFEIIIFNIDHFRQINKVFGPKNGDQLIQMLAQRLRSNLVPDGYLARLGADEFALLVSQPQCKLQLQQLEACVSDKFTIDQRKITITASIGIAIAPTDGDSVIELLKHADVALDSIKSSRNTYYAYFDPQMNAQLLERLELTELLQGALQRQEFELYYQPKIDLRQGGAIVGSEALLRWHSPKGMIPPDRFIPIAEETGLIIPIGEWVLDEACRQLKEWRRGSPDLSVGVNVSPLQFGLDYLPQLVADMLQKHNLPASALELEITEEMTVIDMDKTIEICQSLHELGVEISMDDFGTGYSSLSYLTRIPFDLLKIDRSFMQGIPEAKENTSIVLTILSMAHSMNLKVTAEGAETLEHLTFLRESNCDFVQGYYCSKPLPAEKFWEFMQVNKGKCHKIKTMTKPI